MTSCLFFKDLSIKFLPFELIIQYNFNGSNTDGSYTTAASNSFLSPLEQYPIDADLE